MSLITKLSTRNNHLKALAAISCTLLLASASPAKTVLRYDFVNTMPNQPIEGVSSSVLPEAKLSAPVSMEPMAIKTGRTVSAQFSPGERQMVKSAMPVQAMKFSEGQTFTIQVWFKFHSTSNVGRSILSNRAFKSQNKNMPGFTILMRGDNSNIPDGVGAFVDLGEREVFLTSPEPLKKDVWHHVAVRRDEQGHLDLVLNDVSVHRSGAGYLEPIKSPQVLILGRLGNSQDEGGFFDGIIQSVQVDDEFLYSHDFLPNVAE